MQNLKTFPAHPGVTFTCFERGVFFDVYTSPNILVKHRSGKECLHPINPISSNSYFYPREHIDVVLDDTNHTNRRMTYILSKVSDLQMMAPCVQHTMDDQTHYLSFSVEEGTRPMHHCLLSTFSEEEITKIIEQIRALILSLLRRGLCCYAINETCFLLDKDNNLKCWGLEHLYPLGESWEELWRDHMKIQLGWFERHLRSFVVDSTHVVQQVTSRPFFKWPFAISTSTKPISIPPTSISCSPILFSDAKLFLSEQIINSPTLWKDWKLSSIRDTHTVYTWGSYRIDVEPIPLNVTISSDFWIPQHFRDYNKRRKWHEKLDESSAIQIRKIGVLEFEGINPFLLSDWTVSRDRQRCGWTGNESAFIYAILTSTPTAKMGYKEYIPMRQYLEDSATLEERKIPCLKDAFLFMVQIVRTWNFQAGRDLIGPLQFPTSLTIDNLWVSVPEEQGPGQGQDVTIRYNNRDYTIKPSGCQFWIADIVATSSASYNMVLSKMFQPFLPSLFTGLSQKYTLDNFLMIQ